MDNPIRAMRIFARIVEMNSFTRAAQALGISRATATRTVQELEAALGMPLLVRTTRALRATPEGDAYYRRCLRITADVDELEASIRGAALNPSGPLRVEVPGSVAGAIVLPALGEFHARHPDLVLMLGASVTGQRTAELEFVADGAVRKARLDGIVSVDDEHAYLACGVHGLGLIQPPRVAAQPLIDAGLLREVLPQWRPGAIAVSAVYVKRPHVSPGVRAFVDWMAERFAQDREGVVAAGAMVRPPVPEAIEMNDREGSQVAMA
ncbi:LysR family transcriptional regulator [Burkholderia stabilis]